MNFFTVIAILFLLCVGVARAQSVSITPAGSDEEVQSRIDDLESKVEGLHSAPPPSVTESQAVDDAAALHEMKEEDEENRENAEEQHEEHLKDSKKDAELEAEEKEGDKLAAKERKHIANSIKADEEAVKDQLHHEKEQELAQIDSDEDKELALQDKDAAAEDHLEYEAQDNAAKADDAHEDAVDADAAKATAEAESEMEAAKINEEERKEEEDKEEEFKGEETKEAKGPAEEIKAEETKVEEDMVPAEEQVSTADAYSAAPCPCIKAQMDMEKGCEKGLKVPPKNPCPENAKKMEELKEEEAAVENELKEAEEGQTETAAEAEGEEDEKEEQDLFLQKMSRLLKARRNVPSRGTHTRIARNLRKYALGFF